MKNLYTSLSGYALKCALVLSILIGWNASAQTYPVQTNISTTAPYLNYLSYYGDQNNHLQVTVTNLDFSLPPVLVRLRIRIEGSGYELYTNPNTTVGQPFLLEAGMPLTITGIELLPYLQESNLINPSGANLNDLPHGFTTICVDVIRESASQEVLSTNNCGFLPIQEYQPPQTFIPMCGDVLDTNTMFHNFTWTPPVPFPTGVGLELFYDFTIHQWIDPNNNSALGGNSILIYQQTDLITPTTQVSDFDVQFELGATYIWKVTARVESNGIPISLIENGGVSAPCTFIYGQAPTLNDQLGDGLEIELFTSPSSERKGKAWWTVSDNTPNQGLSTFDAYFVEYRKQPIGNEGFEIPWFSKTLSSFEHFIYQLEPSTTYEVKVSGIIAGTIGNPTTVKTFTTPDPRIYNCGESDLPYLPSNYTPLENATVGTQVQIGQFMMTMTQVTPVGGAGHYAGKGEIPIAFLANAKAKVTFEDILIDTEYLVHEGRVDVVTEGLASWLDDQYQQFIDPYFVNGTIDSAYVQDSVAWVVVDGVAQSFDFDPPNYPIIVNDASGNQYTIYPNGVIVVGTYLSVSETWAVAENETTRFGQNSNETRGFDPMEHMEWYENYETMKLSDNTFYYVANKSMAKGESDKVNVQFPSNVAHVRFELPNGDTIPYTSLDGSWMGTKPYLDSGQVKTLNLPPFSSTGKYEVHAFANNVKVGQLNIHVYSKKEKEVIVVPIANTNITAVQIKSELDRTLGEANIDVNVTLAAQWNNLEFTDTSIISLPSDVGLLNKYSDEMSAIRDAYFFENDLARTDVHYLFLIEGFNDPSELGYFPRGKSYGFIRATQPNLLNTISHELAHGLGALAHSWKGNAPEALSTNNLMDYENTAHPTKENLTQFQWKELRDLDFIPNIWDNEQDASNAISILGELTNSDDIVNYVSSEQVIDKTTFPNSPTIAIVDGQYFKFSDDAWSKIKALKFTNGQLSGLRVQSDNGENHTVILEKTVTHLLPKSSSLALRMVSMMTEGGYTFLCTDTSHQNEREIENVLREGQTLQVVIGGCDHDFFFDDDLIPIECEDVIGTALVAYEMNSFQMEYPFCPDPSSTNFFYIPKSWRNKKDNSFCFMTPDGNILKTSAGGFRGVKYGIGINALEDHSMLPSGCVIEFAHQAGVNDDVITYKADITNGIFNGYKNTNNSTYFNSFKAAHAQDTGIMLLPEQNGLGVYYFDASQYNYVDSNSNGGTILDISTDYNSIQGWAISSSSQVNYSSSDLAQLAISQEAADLLSVPFTNQNNEHRLVAKIVELASAYPDLHTRMSKCPFRQWTGTACMNIGGLLNSIPFHNNPVAAALTENGTWGYFDYKYDQGDYETFPIEEQLRLYIVHFNELIVANRLANLATIQNILNPSNCSSTYTSNNTPSTQIEPEAIFNALNSMNIDEIRSICLQTRLNLIASLSFRPFGVTNDYEKSIYKLIKYVDQNDAYDLVEALCTDEYNNVVLVKQIAETVHDEVMFFGDDNYFSEIAKTLIKHYATESNVLTDMNFSELTTPDFEEYSKRLVTYNYTGFVKRLFTSCGTPALAGNGATMSTVTMTNGASGWKIGFEDNLEICFSNVRSSNNRSFGLLEPLIISDDARLMSLNDETGSAIVMPAFILFFLEEKAWAKTAVEAIETTIDAVSLFIPGAQGKLFFRVINYADKLSSITNMGANYTQIDNPTLSSFLAVTSGVLGLADIAATGVTNFRKVKNGSASEQQVFDLITRDQNKLSENHTKAINDLLEVVDENSDADLIKILGSPEAKGHFIELLEAEDDYLRKLGHTGLANDVKLRVNALKVGTSSEVVDLSLIQLINGSYPKNAADFAGLNFSFDLVGNPRMRSIMDERWKGYSAVKKAKLELKFANLHASYPNGVNFSPEGFPIFTPYAYIHNGEHLKVDIGALHPDPPTGSGGSNGSLQDMSFANETMEQIDPSWTKPEGYTWHHIENTTQLELVPTNLHDAVRHSGGRSTCTFGVWLDDLETLLGGGARSDIEAWIASGLNSTRVASAFALSSNKAQLLQNLTDAKSVYHQMIITKDYKNIPGILRSSYTDNSLNSAVVHASQFNESNPAYDLPSYRAATFTQSVQLVSLPAGTKLYRVTDAGGEAGGFWTLNHPSAISDVIGLTAVMPEWNGFTKVVEYTVPMGGIKVWKGKAARQPVSELPQLQSNKYSLKGGGIQVFINNFVRDAGFEQNIVDVTSTYKSW